MNKFDFRAKRIPVELKQLGISSKNHGITCKLKSDDNFTSLEAKVPGPAGTPYEGGIFKLNVEVGDHYPFQPPTMKFITPIFHPNIDNNGNICLDLLQMPPKGSYNPALTLESLLMSIQLLLSSPNTDDPLQDKVASLYIYNREKYKKDAAEFTKKYATCEEIVPSPPKKERLE